MALVILGLGNDLIGDDGVGLLAAARLEGRLGPDVAVRTSAQSGLYLLEYLQEFDDAIVIDSILGDVPGRVRELEERQLPPTTVPSAHYAGLPEVLAIARAAGMRMPSRLKVIAVEIEGAQTIGASPSPAILAAIPRVMERALATAHAWGYDEGKEASPDA
jgi:hydrogenase maturation protease